MNRRLCAQNHDFTLLAVQNRGRDILPFLKIMPAVLKGGHDNIIKVHTKQSSHRQDGAAWRRDLYGQLLTEKSVDRSLRLLAQNPQVGILGPTGHIVPMRYYWGSNAGRVAALAGRLGINGQALADLHFVAGSMFFARVKALHPLLNLALPEKDFEPEAGQIDGTLAHAIERLISVSAHSAGYETASRSHTTTSNYRFAQRTAN